MHTRLIRWIFCFLLLAALLRRPLAVQAAEGERYALLVGVSTYRSDSGFNNLKYPESDVIALKDALLELGFDEANIRLMVKSSPDERFNPRRENILKELKLLLANKNKDDTVIVVLSGHGLQPRAKDGAYFCPSDAVVKESETWLDLETVFEQLKNCGAGGKLLIADCCRDDPALANIKGLPQDVQSVTRPGKLKPPQNVAALFSCGNGEVAYEEEELKGGVFAHFLVQGLKGQAAFNGEIEIKSLAGYLQKKVYDYVSAKRGASQVPSFRMESDRLLVLAKVEPDELKLDLGGGVALEVVRVRPGEFLMGRDPNDPETPEYLKKEAHKVKFTQGFYIGKYPVTVGQFKRFVATTGYKTDADRIGTGYTLKDGNWDYYPGANWMKPGFEQADDHPVVMMSWDDANEFTKWATKQTGKTVSLPTQAEWEYAARGPENLKYPWGNTWDGTKANHADQTLKTSNAIHSLVGYSDDNDGYVYTAPVGHFKNESWCGAFDMAGNAWQWCGDVIKTDGNDPDRRSKGGSWSSEKELCRSADGTGGGHEIRTSTYGFRIAVNAPSVKLIR